MMRLLVEDVTLILEAQIVAKIRFKGGATETLRLDRPLRSWEIRQTSPEVIEQIDCLLNECTDAETAKRLNADGFKSGTGLLFNARLVARARRQYKLKSRYDRLREAGMLTQKEVALQLGIHPHTVHHWRKHGLVVGHPYNDKNECLYEPVRDGAPIKHHGIKLTDPRRFPNVVSDRTNEV